MDSYGELSSCSRSEACANASQSTNCLVFDDFLCHVEDPCSCIATLTDFNGKVITNCTVQEPESNSNDAQVIETSKPEEINYFFDGKLLKVIRSENNTALIPIKTRCQVIKEATGGGGGDGSPACDPISGSFLPKQCLSPEDCFCVDDAGRLVEEQEKGENCERIEISEIRVVLSFPTRIENIQQLEFDLRNLLYKIGGQGIISPKIEFSPETIQTQVHFILIGSNSVDVSYFLENLVVGSSIGVQDQGKFIPASFSGSSFIHIRQEKEETTPKIQENVVILSENDADNEINDDDEQSQSQERRLLYSSYYRNLDGEMNTVGILLTLVAAISACLLVFGVFLTIQKKNALNNGGNANGMKKPWGGYLGPFSSGLYEVEQKKTKKTKNTSFFGYWGSGIREAVTIPTFKIQSPFNTSIASSTTMTSSTSTSSSSPETKKKSFS
jgi:hypothetical protein